MAFLHRAIAAGAARRFLGLSGVLAILAWPAAASAQLSPNVSGSSTTTTFDSEEAMRTLTVFGTCYARLNTDSALALIATEPASRQEAETYRQLFRRDNQSCLGEATEIRMPVALVRGAIAEGLYKRRIPLPANLALSAPAAGSVRTLSEAARCYTVDHRDQVRNLVEQTPPGSRREFEALSAMASDFFRCVPETARGRSFEPTQVRFRLAEALLRLPE